jgi:hypothetical protein
MKCSFCKLNYIESNLKKMSCSNKKGFLSICKPCERKIDINEYLENKKDALYLNSLKYISTKKGIYLNDNLLETCKLNAKLKREIKNATKTN